MTASADARPSRLLACIRIAGLTGLFLTYLPPHLVSKAVFRRSSWPRRFLGAAARIAGAKVRIEGAPLQPHTLGIANHTSWLDILILGGSVGTAFVSKAEVRQTPLIGWLADQNHTLYIDRAERSDAHGQVRRIAAALGEPQPLTVFPEGTTGDGRHLLPFRSTLLEAVAPAPPDVAVRPIAVDYGEGLDGIAWHSGERGIANVLKVLGRRGRLPVTVRLLDPLPRSSDRKALARQARTRIAAALPSVRGASGL